MLVGTTSIENSELLSGFLEKEKLPHQVLNAKQHAREAEIIAQAGTTGAITIATNMAGRGTDIVLGGTLEPLILKLRDDETVPQAEKDSQIAKMRADWQVRHNNVVKAGGLHIVGTERHESRRIDNQLRGRAGRQGDPGSSRFFLSLEDPLLRIFGGERLGTIMQKLKMPDGEPIEHPIVNRSIAKAQNRVESRNFDIRKQLLEYDDVANDQRRVIYQQRNELLEGDDIADTIRNMVRGQVEDTVKLHVPPESVEEQWDVPALTAVLAGEYQIDAPVAQWMKDDSELTDEMLRERVVDLAEAAWRQREASVGPELMRQFERSLMLQTLDHHWRDHLAALDHLRQGIHLRGYAQKNPKQEYKREAFELFSDMLDRIKQDVVKVVLTVTVRNEQDVQAVEEAAPVSNVQYQHAGYDEALASARRPTATSRWRRRRRSPAPARRSGATTCVHAGRERNTSTATVESDRDAGAMTWGCGRIPQPFFISPNLRCPSTTRRPLPSRCCPVQGVALGAAAASIKKWTRDDVLLVLCEPGTVAAGVFTQNRFCAAPVIVCRENIARQHATGSNFRALVVNAGNANAGTGDRGLADARAECVAVARLIDCAPEEVLPFSTGVIMEPLPVDKIIKGLPAARAAARADGWFAAARAIMTTDTVPKAASRRVDVGGAAGHGHGHREGRGDDPPRHGDDAVVHRHRRADRRGAAGADRARGRRRIVQRRDGRWRHVHQRQLRARGNGQGGHGADHAIRPTRAWRRSAPRSSRSPSAGAGHRPRRRGRDQVHRDPRRGRQDGGRVQARRVRHRAFAAGQDRVLRVRPQPRAHRVRDRQHGRPPTPIRPGFRSGSTTCWSSTAAAAPRATARKTASA